jgi:integrase
MSLCAFYQAVFEPSVVELGLHKNTAYRYRHAVDLFVMLNGDRIIAELDPAVLRELERTLVGRGMRQRDAAEYRRALARVLRCADPSRFPVVGGRPPKAAIANEPRGKRMTASHKMPEPIGAEGTLVEFHNMWFKNEVLKDAAPITRTMYLALLRRMRDCFGRDVMLNELGPQLLERFLSWLAGHGMRVETIRKHRKNLLCIWGHAHSNGMAGPAPRTRQPRIARDPPDSWTPDEMKRLVAAARALEVPAISRINAGDFWVGLLSVAWFTGMRRATLLRLRWSYLHPSGLLRVPGRDMKNYVGQVFKLPNECLEALRAIEQPKRNFIFGGLVHERVLSRHFHRILKAACVPLGDRQSLRLFHRIRRSVATRVAEVAGLDAAAALLGHSTAALLRRYVDPRVMVASRSQDWLPPLTQSGDGVTAPVAPSPTAPTEQTAGAAPRSV